MKKVLLLLAIWSGNCSAQGLNLDPWTREDTYWQVAYTTLLVLDCAQTRWSAGRQEWKEDNPFVGSANSKGRINNICVSTGLLHFGVAYILSPYWRRVLQVSSVVVETGVVLHNASVGLKMEF